MEESRIPDVVEDYDELLEGPEHRWRNRLIGLAVLAALLAAGTYGLFAMVLGGGGEPTEEIQTATVARGSITNAVSTSGVVVAQSTTNLSFDQSGRVSAVNVTLGQEVKAGDVLAEIESDEVQDALATAEVNLSSVQTRLSQLLKGSTESELASADQSVIQAQANYDQAVRTLQDLADGPSASEGLSAEQAVVSAQANYDQAKLSASDLTAAATDSERITAEQAVISAQAQLDQANRTLSDLAASPTDSEALSAQQAVTSAQAQLHQAEASRAQLDSANDDAIAAAEAAVRKAQNALDNAERTAENAARSLMSAQAALAAEESAYCNIPPGSTPSFCPAATAAPISFTDEQALLAVRASGTPAADAAHAASVLAANTSYENALATKESADAAVDSAEADLEAAEADLSEAESGPGSSDIANADAAVTAAEQALDAAEAKLAELYEGPTESEQETAQANVDVATAALEGANAKRAELYEGPTQSQLQMAQDNVITAAASLATANAKLAELDEGPTQSEIETAQDNVETAAASLASAVAKRNDVYDGADWEDIEQQRDSVQLAELSVERAKKDLEKAQIVAPFDGTVAALNVEVGEVAGGAGGDAAVILNTPNAVRLELTITESDLPDVKVGQSGFASFDALEGTALPIVIDSVGLNPTTTQGVVTYQVRASFVSGQTAVAAGAQSGPRGAMLAGAAEVLGMTEEELQVALQSGQSMTEIGEARGISTDDLRAALSQARGAAAPDAAIAGQAGAEATPQAGTPAAEATPAAGDGGLPDRARELLASVDTDARPLPGMNASVTIIVDQRQDVITVPAQAIQVEGRDSIVEVQKEDGTTERLVVETGLSDGTNTEIVRGLEEGQTIIIPGRAAAAVQPAAAAGFPGPTFRFEEGGPPGEGGPIIIGGGPP